MIEEIRNAVKTAALRNQKLAMFHYQVVKNAALLENIDPVSFCRDVGVPESYKTEFRQMLSLARVMREQGTRLA